MRRGRLPLTALRAFEAAGRAESISVAAQELCVSQAAVSRQIRDLEAQMGVLLFERVHRGVRLTQAGRSLLGALTDAFDGMEGAIAEICQPATETITVSCDPSFATCWLAPRLSAFREISPDTDIVLNADPRVVDFGNDDTVLAIRYSKERSSWPRVEARKLCDARLFAFLAPELASSAEIRTPDDLLTLPRLYEDNRDDWSTWFTAAGVMSPAENRGTMFNESSMMLQAAIAGQGIALTDELFGGAAVARGDLVRPFDISIPGGAYWLASRSFNRLPPGARRFAKWLMDSIICEDEQLS